MTKRIYESQGTMSVTADKGLRVCLITEGAGTSADFPREFFTEKNAEALAGSLSFPAHPMDLDHPEFRNPLDAIGSIGDKVTIEEHDGKMGFYGEYIPAKSKPQIAEYLKEFGPKLGLSIYGDSDGRQEGHRWVAESFDGADPYKSVDLVVAAGRGGKFEKVAESLGLLPKASATAEENEGNQMEIKELADKVDRLVVLHESLLKTLTDGKLAEAQVEVNDAAVKTAVDARLAEYATKDKLITDAKLSESQTSDLRAAALAGDDIVPGIEKAKTVLAEALKLAGVDPTDDDAKDKHQIAEHLRSNHNSDSDFDVTVPGFGSVN